MAATSNEGPDQGTRLYEIGQLLGKAVRERRKWEGRLMQVEDEARIQEALQAVMRICHSFREAVFEQVHSVRVKQVTGDFDALAEWVRALEGQTLTEGDQEKVRARIKAWHHESRRWVAELPLQAAVMRLSGKDGLAGSVRIDRLHACWQEARAAYFAPPPPSPKALPQGVPDHFQLAPLGLPPDWCMDPMDAVMPEVGRPKWECRPDAVLEVLDWAREVLLLEVGARLPPPKILPPSLRDRSPDVRWFAGEAAGGVNLLHLLVSLDHGLEHPGDVLGADLVLLGLGTCGLDHLAEGHGPLHGGFVSRH